MICRALIVVEYCLYAFLGLGRSPKGGWNAPDLSAVLTTLSAIAESNRHPGMGVADLMLMVSTGFDRRRYGHQTNQ
jgi:hypothetical protein